MISSGVQKLLVVLGTLLLLLFLGYKIFTGNSPESVVTVTGRDIPVGEFNDQDILSLVAQVEAISIDQNFFSTALFTSLVDYQIPIQPEAQGKPNPFASFGSTGTGTKNPLPKNQLLP